ncbi:MAG: MMPL family transporter [Actinomycetota bacterium]|nr:MMPL family transporter [Actinomycetota bacterium]
MFERLGRAAAEKFVVVVLAWVVAGGVVYAVAPPLKKVVTSDITAFLTQDAQSVVASRELRERFPSDDFSNSAAAVFSRTSRLSDSDLAYLDEIETWLNSPEKPRVVVGAQSAQTHPELKDVLTSRDGTIQILLVRFSTPPFEPPTNHAVDEIRSRVSHGPVGLHVNVTGNAGVAADQANAIDHSIKRTTAITLGLVILILLYVYRSPITPLVPLITIGVAFTVSSGIIALLAQAGMKTSSLVENFMVVIVFGAGTDYCLFIISRFREEVAHTHEYTRTLAGTVAIVGAVIASSASTVIVGFTSQGVARFGMFRTTGPAMAVAVVVTLTAGLTLTPALMRAFGRSLFWPAHPELLASEGRLPEFEAASRVAVGTGADE